MRLRRFQLGVKPSPQVPPDPLLPEAKVLSGLLRELAVALPPEGGTGGEPLDLPPVSLDNLYDWLALWVAEYVEFQLREPRPREMLIACRFLDQSLAEWEALPEAQSQPEALSRALHLLVLSPLVSSPRRSLPRGKRFPAFLEQLELPLEALEEARRAGESANGSAIPR